MRRPFCFKFVVGGRRLVRLESFERGGLASLGCSFTLLFSFSLFLNFSGLPPTLSLVAKGIAADGVPSGDKNTSVSSL
jgi:hypothetical protein